MNIYDELKNELEKIENIKDFVLLTKFLKFTNGGDGLYQLNLNINYYLKELQQIKL